MKTGVNMSTVINTRSKKYYEIRRKKSGGRQRRARICIDCKYNNEGYCSKYKSWCGRVNHHCLGIRDPYAYKFPKPKQAESKKKKN